MLLKVIINIVSDNYFFLIGGNVFVVYVKMLMLWMKDFGVNDSFFFIDEIY